MPTAPAILPQAQKPSYRAFPVNGDNMQPTLCEGDVAIVQPISEYSGPGIYIYETPLGPEMRRIGPCDYALRLVASSDNPMYGRFEVDLEFFQANVLAKVRMRIAAVDGHGPAQQYIDF